MFSCRDENKQSHTHSGHAPALLTDNEHLMSGDVITTNTQLPATDWLLPTSSLISAQPLAAN